MTSRMGSRFDAPTLDGRTLAGLHAELGSERIATLVGLFAERSSDIEDLVSAVRRADAKRTARLAHSLRGSAAIFGATRLAELSAELEDRGLADEGVAGELDGTTRLATEIAAEFDRVVGAMRQAIDGPPVGGALSTAA